MENFNQESEPAGPIAGSPVNRDELSPSKVPGVRRPYAWIIAWVVLVVIIAFSAWYFMTRERPITPEERKAIFDTVPPTQVTPVSPERTQSFQNQNKEIKIQSIPDSASNERIQSFGIQNN